MNTRDTIYLTTQRDMRIYMHPMRQSILRRLQLTAGGMTAKQVADAFAITPSSAANHLRQLVQIGVLRLGRTEQVHGFTAQYYEAEPVTVSFSRTPDGMQDERRVLFARSIQALFDRVMGALDERIPTGGVAIDTIPVPLRRDVRSGVLHLTPQEAEAALSAMEAFLSAHQAPREGTIAFEYALLYAPGDAEAEG